MARQYWVGEFFVDLSRNQISYPGQSQTLPPKALQVLTHLAQHRGKVVSHDELLDHVWPDTVVTPNTLQRSIAQLRKALGQDMIKTHAKQGYSLECEVNWSAPQQSQAMPHPQTDDVTAQDAQSEPGEHQSSPVTHAAVSTPSASASGRRKLPWRMITFALMLLLSGLALYVAFLAPQPPLQLGKLRYLTATDDKEFGATYSSDGNYILFRRYLNQGCVNTVWAKDAQSLEEFQLTAESGNYGDNSLSPDGKTLAFIQQHDCDVPVTQTTCYKLMTLNFQAALREPQLPSLQLDCQHSAIRKPVWVDDQHIVMIQQSEQQWRLIRHSLNTGSSEVLYEADARIIDYSWSQNKRAFALTVFKRDGLQYIEKLTANGQVLSSQMIRLPPKVPRHLQVRVSHVPNSDRLIFADGTYLYTLAFDGTVQRARFQVDEAVGAPYFHPNGNRLLLIKGTYDSDIVRIALQDSGQTAPDTKMPLDVFERSINREDLARYNPTDHRIAYVSAKTGKAQVWIDDNGRSKAVSHFEHRMYISNLQWDKAGRNLMVLANGELFQIMPGKSPRLYRFKHPVEEMFHWDSETRQVIANVLVKGLVRFVRIDLDTLQYELINQKQVVWAAKNSTGQLVYVDNLARFWRYDVLDDEYLDALTGQLATDQRFVFSDDTLYGINKQHQLWAYDMANNSVRLLGQVGANIDYLTDSQGDELFATLVNAAKKEVVELSLQ